MEVLGLEKQTLIRSVKYVTRSGRRVLAVDNAAATDTDERLPCALVPMAPAAHIARHTMDHEHSPDRKRHLPLENGKTSARIAMSVKRYETRHVSTRVKKGKSCEPTETRCRHSRHGKKPAKYGDCRPT